MHPRALGFCAVGAPPRRFSPSPGKDDGRRPRASPLRPRARLPLSRGRVCGILKGVQNADARSSRKPAHSAARPDRAWRSSPPAVRIETLGCKVNRADSEAIAAELARRGYRIAGPDERAVASIVNTCTVTHVADAKARKLIRRLARDGSQAPVIVTGCYAERAAAALAAIPGVARVVSNQAKGELARIVAELVGPADARPTGECAAQPRPARPGSARAFVAVQDGCDHRCSYCIVPQVRGPMRSRPVAEVLAEIQALAAAGAGEVVICGIRLGAYGEEPEGRGLARLLRAARNAEVPRLRLSSVEPWDVGPELIAEISDHPLVCPHLHLPLQSADEAVLRAMRRPQTYADYRALAERLRAAMPDLAVTTDLMVGFPGETEAAFASTCRAVAEIGFARVHVFRYSPRPGTSAAIMPEQVPETAKAARAARLAELAEASGRRFAARFVGRSVRVLFEECAQGTCSGLTEAYLTARVSGSPSLVGQLAGVQVLAVESNGIAGRVARPVREEAPTGRARNRTARG